MTITSLKSALQRIAQLERENEQLRAELEVYKNRNTGGRKKHDEANAGRNLPWKKVCHRILSVPIRH